MMGMIKGLKEFRCQEPDWEGWGSLTGEDWFQTFLNGARKTVEWLEKEMTAPKDGMRANLRRDDTAIVHISSRPSKLTERVAVLEQERKELNGVVHDVVSRLEKVENELGKVRRAVAAIADAI